MVDKNNPAANASGHQTFKEAVCIDVARVYDSCSDKDCLEDLRVYFNDENQTIVNNAFAVKSRNAELANVFVDVEPVQFNRGFYSVDITFCFDVSLEVFDRPCGRTGRKPCIVSGIAVFNKRVILFGSEGNVKVFTSDNDDENSSGSESNDLPKAVVEAVDPVFLAARLVDADGPVDSTQVPEMFSERLEGSLGCVVPLKLVLVTLGLFSIVKLERNVQMLIPAYDFCIPDKECASSSSDPCDLFKNIKFPVNEFFPPRFSDGENPANAPDCGCGESQEHDRGNRDR
jgi:hypothetical protein